MKQILIIATIIIGLAGAGCAHKSVCNSCATPQAAGAPVAATIPATPVQNFQPYTLVSQTAPKPAVAPHRNRYLHIAKRDGQTYLADYDGRYYHIGRDPHGHIYPAYYDVVTRQNYPLYYDRSRDRYYRVLRRQNNYYVNFVDDNSGQYYECDQDLDYSSYDPPQEDCPVIWDGYYSFTYYNQPDYYSYSPRYRHHWHDDDWFIAVPILLGAYFVLNEDDDPGPAWYYGYQGNNYHDRWAYQQNNFQAPVTFSQNGRQVTQNITVTPPASAMVPRQQWAHDASVYGNHRSPSQAWSSDNRTATTHAVAATAAGTHGSGATGTTTQSVRNSGAAQAHGSSKGLFADRNPTANTAHGRAVEAHNQRQENATNAHNTRLSEHNQRQQNATAEHNTRAAEHSQHQRQENATAGHNTRAAEHSQHQQNANNARRSEGASHSEQRQQSSNYARRSQGASHSQQRQQSSNYARRSQGASQSEQRQQSSN
jgi:hypothetical protein